MVSARGTRYRERIEIVDYGIATTRQVVREEHTTFLHGPLGAALIGATVVFGVVAFVALCLSGYFTPATWRTDALEFSDAPFEVETRAPYVQAQALL